MEDAVRVLDNVLEDSQRRAGDDILQGISTPDPSGYRMIKAISIENFRSFQGFQLNDLRLINIIVGRNAAGKTAFLESVRLAFGGTPAIAWTLNQLRGHPVLVQPNPNNQQFEIPWRPLFLNFDLENEIRTTFKDSDGRSATLRVFFDPERAITPSIQVSTPKQGGPVTANWGPASPIIPLVFERSDLSEQSSTLLATINQIQPNYFQLHLEPGPELGSGVEFFPSSWQFNSQQVAQWFSQLSIENKEAPIKEAIRNEFEFISDLSVQAPYNIATVHATMGYLQQKIPLSLVSSGINKLFVFMTAIINYGRGVVLIDELENGLHSSILPHMWEFLHRLGERSQTQLFVTTHSWECLKAALPLIEKSHSQFCLIRIEREGLRSIPRQFTGKDLASALEEEFDIRY
jgi:predicted ATPase